MEAKSIDADAIFKVFTACPNDPKTLILDVRPHKDFKKQHINQAYCVRVSSNRQVLADYSQSSYSLPWSQHCWWGKAVIVYGPAGVNKDHNVVKFLTTEGRCTSVQYYKPGFEAFEARYPHLCTPSVKASSIKKYPSMVVPGILYLGDWSDAQAHDRLKEMGIKRIVTIHNHPERLAVLPGVQHLKLELADVEGADISPYFNEVYEFLADAEQRKQPTLVHCGAGVSRSACLVMMYLMRSRLWSAQKARDHCIAARSLVCPNDGFWRVLCVLEGPLGILDRSDPDATMGFAGADAPPTPELDKQAAGLPVTVKMITATELKKQQQEEEAAKAAAAAAAAEEEDRRRQEAEAAAAAGLRQQEAAAAAAAAAAQRDEQQKHVAAVEVAEAQHKHRLKRGRSPSPTGTGTGSQSTSTSSSSSSSSSDTSSSSSSSSSSASSSSSDASSSDGEAARARSRSLDRNKPRHRSRSLDRSAAAARRKSFEKRSSGKDIRDRKTHRSSRSRSRSTGRVQLRRGGGEEVRRRGSRSRSESDERGRGRRSKHSERGRDGSRDRVGGSDRGRDKPADRDGDRVREGKSDSGKGRDRGAPRDRDRTRDRDRGDWRQGRSRSRDRHRDRGEFRQQQGGRDRSNQGWDAAAADGDRSDRSRRRDRSSSRDRRQQQHRQQPAGDRDSSRQNGHAGPQQPRALPPAAAAAAAATGVSSQLPAAPPPPPLAAAAVQSGWLVTLDVTKPEGVVGRLVLGPMNLYQRVVIGRAPSCNVVLEHLSVSRQHAQLFVDLAGTVHVMDMGAAHGTKLNDTWIKAQQPKAVPVGSQLRFGASTRVYTLLSVDKV